MLDLHIHSTYSDGWWTPKEIVAQAQAKKLYGLALTDHDTLAGLEEMAALCQEAQLYFLPGIEFSLEVEDREVHLLAYGVDDRDPDLLALCQDIQQEKIRRTQVALDLLARAGLPIEEEAFWPRVGANPNRLHLAQALVDQGLVANTREAFARYLGRGRPFYVPKKALAYQVYLDLVQAKGYLSFVAHPKTVGSDQVVAKLLDQGVDGLEVINEKHSLADVLHYRQMAQARGKRISGGSDCHGRRVQGSSLLGNYKISKDYFI